MAQRKGSAIHLPNASFQREVLKIVNVIPVLWEMEFHVEVEKGLHQFFFVLLRLFPSWKGELVVRCYFCFVDGMALAFTFFRYR